MSILHYLLLASTVAAHKILMAGSLEHNEHAFFTSVAHYITKSLQGNHTVYMLEHTLDYAKEKEVFPQSENIFGIQVPDILSKKLQQTKGSSYSRRIAEMGRFQWNAGEMEEENFVRIDVEHVDAYFAQDSSFIDFLKEMKFDIGVGGSQFADSLLFRALGIDYLKLNSEDIESYTMQFKFNMPVLLSAYPSSQVAANYDYDDIPHSDSQRYRWAMNRGYTYNRMFSRSSYMNRVKLVLPKDLHYPLIDSFDQDHAMILGEGTKVGVLQSIMMKPPNVQPVFPLRDEDSTLRTKISLDVAANKKGPIFIFNTETHDVRSLMGISGHSYFSALLLQFKDIENTFKRGDFDIAILYHPSKEYMTQNMVKRLGIKQATLVPTTDPFNIEFTPETQAQIDSSKRMKVWISQCTQPNFLTAFEKMKAPIIGFANEDYSPTQVFNCHKLNQFSAGVPLQVEDMESQFLPALKQVVDLDSEMGKNIQGNVTFYYHLLADDERISKMDLEYWLDYIVLFGVGDIIPLYDKAGILAYRNWDVYLFLWGMCALITFAMYKCCKCCFSPCRRSVKNKVE